MATKRVESLGMSIPLYQSSRDGAVSLRPEDAIPERPTFSHSVWQTCYSTYNLVSMADVNLSVPYEEYIYLHGPPPHAFFYNLIDVREIFKIRPFRWFIVRAM